MNVKAVFLDIDGTWYDHKTNQIFKENIEAVKKLQEKGIKVALCSGRPKEMAADLHVFENMNWDGYIGVSGGVVHDENLKIIYRNTYTQEQLKEMNNIAQSWAMSYLEQELEKSFKKLERSTRNSKFLNMLEKIHYGFCYSP